jgi:hypothetical protein
MVVLLAVLLPDDPGDTGIGLAAFSPGTGAGGKSPLIIFCQARHEAPP